MKILILIFIVAWILMLVFQSCDSDTNPKTISVSPINQTSSSSSYTKTLYSSRTPVDTTVNATPTSFLPRAILDSEKGEVLRKMVNITEESGRNYISGSSPGNLPQNFNKILGTEQRKCIDLEIGRQNGLATLRSGEFVIRTMFPSQTKVSWDQLHTSEDYVLKVSALMVGTSNTTLNFGPFKAVKNGIGYPSEIKLPNYGIWLLVATADVNWGCFIVVV